MIFEECVGGVIAWPVDAEPVAGSVAPLAKIGMPRKLLASARVGRAYRIGYTLRCIWGGAIPGEDTTRQPTGVGKLGA